jgi:hypothetical protein
MRVGTKSVLFGAHCFFLHPWFVAAAWRKLYGFPWDPRLWVAFFVHDIGYLGKPNMDGPEGEAHPEFGARIMGRLFDRDRFGMGDAARYRWHDFCLFHSRFYAKKEGVNPSLLCVADKLSICLTPAWLYLPMARATGEIHEYMKHADEGKYVTMNIPTARQRDWYLGVQEYLRRWVAEHRDGRPDTWTPGARTPRDANGVWS